MLIAAAVIVAALLAIVVITVKEGDDHYNSVADDDAKVVIGTHSEGGVLTAGLGYFVYNYGWIKGWQGCNGMD